MRTRLLLLAALMTFLGACSAGGAVLTNSGGASEDAMRYLALGDSYTIGQGVEASSRWPVLLTSAMARAGCGEYALTMLARTGWTAAELHAEMRRQALQGPYELITVQVGVNDQYRGLPVEDFHRDLTDLLQDVRGLAGPRPEGVIVVSIPDWSASPIGAGEAGPGTSVEIDEYNRDLARTAAEFGFRYVDVTDLTRAGGMDPEMFTSDGLHYSRAMHELWAERLAPEACQAIRGGAP